MHHNRYALCKTAKIVLAVAAILVTVTLSVKGDCEHGVLCNISKEHISNEHSTNHSTNPSNLPKRNHFVTAEEIYIERTEEEQHSQRENVLYYVLDSGYRYDLPIEYQDYLWEKCKEYGIQEHYTLLLAQMYHESSFNLSVISRTNDYGLMQINVCNHNWLRQQLGISDFLNPYDSIDAGVYMMSNYLQKYNVHKALMSYNMGEGGMRNSGLSESTYSRGVISDINLLHVLTP